MWKKSDNSEREHRGERGETNREKEKVSQIERGETRGSYILRERKKETGS